VANVPNLLSSVRLFLVPVLLLLAWADQRRLFLPCLVVSLVTDAADGFLARKLNQATELGAKLDSWADFLTYLSLPVCAWRLWPDVVREQAAFLTALIFCYLVPVVLGFLKFRRLTSYHTVANKVLAVPVAAAALGLLGWGVGWPFRVLLPLVAIVELEEIAITIVLSQWRANVPSLWHALQITRREAQK